MESKGSLRRVFREKRKALSPEAIESANEAIRINFISFLESYRERVSLIHIFLPIKKNREVDTWPIVQAIRERFPEMDMAVPKSDMEHERMDAVLLEKDTEFDLNPLSIPEPKDGKQVDPQRIDLMVLPLLAYDRQGDRVGYGKGFYDSFLAHCKPALIKVGLSFFEPVPRIKDTAPHDIHLDHCVTPETTHNFNR